MKNALKFTAIALIFVSLILVPLVGVTFYDSPSVFEDDAFYTNRQFGKGTSVLVGFDEEAGVDESSLKNAAETLKNRFLDVGYSDTVVEVEGDAIRLDIAQTSFVDSVISEMGAIGHWEFVSPSQNAVCNASMVESASIAQNAGNYYVTLHFTEEGASTFASNCSSIAASSGSIYLLVDGQYASYVNLSNATFGSTFTFGAFQFSSAAQLVATINNGELPGEVQILSASELPATLSGTALWCICGAFLLIFVVYAILYLIKGKLVGLFALLALVSDAAILLTAFANKFLMLYLPTVIGAAVLLCLAGLFYLYATAKTAKCVAAPSSLSKAVKSVNKLFFWTHGLLLFALIIAVLYATGTFAYLVRETMLFTFFNALVYGVMFLFPVFTLSDAKTNKK